MRGPHSATSWTPADHTPKTSDVLRRARATAERGLAAVRRAASRGSSPRSSVTARYSEPPRHRLPHGGAAGAAGMGGICAGPDGHAVLFYSSVDELTGQVREFLLEAMCAGGVAVVVATPAHRDSIAAALADAGIDVAASQAAGLYVALDAFETMNRFMVADWPNAASFWEVISPIVARAAEA